MAGMMIGQEGKVFPKKGESEFSVDINFVECVLVEGCLYGIASSCSAYALEKEGKKWSPPGEVTFQLGDTDIDKLILSQLADIPWFSLHLRYDNSDRTLGMLKGAKGDPAILTLIADSLLQGLKPLESLVTLDPSKFKKPQNWGGGSKGETTAQKVQARLEAMKSLDQAQVLELGNKWALTTQEVIKLLLS